MIVMINNLLIDKMKYCVLVLSVIAVLADNKKYDGWKSYYVRPSTHVQLEALEHLSSVHEVDIIRHPNLESDGVILVMPELQSKFTKALDDEGIYYKIHRKNLKLALDFDSRMIEIRSREFRFRSTRIKEMPFDNYQELPVIYEYLDDIAKRFPETVTLVQPAYSFEGRPIKYLKISSTNFEDFSKPIIFIDGGIHAREWITPPTVTYFIHKLTENLTDVELLDAFDWILLPVTNPDGYAFSFEEDRLWRKTRSTNQHILSNICPGVDGNRNYDIFWNTSGSSPMPCHDTYPGSYPFSEIETKIVQDILQEHFHRISMYISMHSFGSMILYPWGYDGSHPDYILDMHAVAVAMADEIYSHQLPQFPRYVVGNSAELLYPAAGSSDDYAHSLGIPLSYTFELPGLSNGSHGFFLEVEYIEQVCRETWKGVTIGVRKAGEMFIANKKKS